MVRGSEREVRASYYRDEEKDMGKERNCNIGGPSPLPLSLTIDNVMT